MEMFKNDSPEIQHEAKKIIKKATEKIKKDNIMIWLLRRLRAALRFKFANNNGQPIESSTTVFLSIINSVEHFISLPIPEIQNYDYGDKSYSDIMEDFRIYEQKWIEENAGKIDMTEAENTGRGPRKIVDVGDGWFWFDLQKQYCSEEGRAMGHCGNAGNPQENHTVLSLRKISKKGNRIYASPHATFILDKHTGKLGEMKGRGNKKPTEEYHPAIIKLLLHKYTNSLGIRGWLIHNIVGGGYMPEENFSISDLSEEHQKELFSVRPELRPLELIYKSDGHTPEFEKALISKIHAEYPTMRVIVTPPRIYLKEAWPDWEDFLHDVGSPKNLSNYKSYILGDDYWDYDVGEVSRDTQKDFFTTICYKNKIIYNRIRQHILEDYEEEMTDYEDMFECLYDNNDEIISLIDTSLQIGQSHGSESQMYKAFKNGVENVTVYIGYGADGIGVDVLFSDQSQWMDSPLDAIFGIEDMCKILDQGELDLFNSIQDTDGDMSVPYYGFDDYDESAAIENFTSELNI